MENRFKRVMASKSDIELRRISENKDDYEDDARIAAISELEVRSNSDDNYQDIKDEINSSKLRIEKHEEEVNELKTVPEDIPATVNWAVYLLYLIAIVSLANVIYVMCIKGMRFGVISFLFYAVYKMVIFYTIHSIRLKLNSARIVILLLFICWLPFAIKHLLVGITLFISFGVVIVTNYLSLLYIILYLLAFSLLFTGKGHEWFSGRKKRRSTR